MNNDFEKLENLIVSGKKCLRLVSFRNNIANYIYSTDDEGDEAADLIMASIDDLGKGYVDDEGEIDIAGLTDLELTVVKKEGAVREGYEREISN